MLLAALALGALQRAASPRCAAAPFRELEAFSKIAYPEAWPFTPDYLARQDEESDAVFYDEPRFVTHIDDGAIGALMDDGEWELLCTDCSLASDEFPMEALQAGVDLYAPSLGHGCSPSISFTICSSSESIPRESPGRSAGGSSRRSGASSR